MGKLDELAEVLLAEALAYEPETIHTRQL